MVSNPQSFQSRRRTGRRYTILVFLVLALAGGWTWFWTYAADRAHQTLNDWRAREAKAGRVYECDSQSLGGFPFRFELECAQAVAELRKEASPLQIKTGRVVLAMQVYDPTLLIGDFTGPVTLTEPGQQLNIVANWKVGQASVRGTPREPERASLVFEQAVVDRTDVGAPQNLLRASRIELHSRIAKGSADSNPVIEMVLRLAQASMPGLHPAAVVPVDGDITLMLRGLKDFAPKSWAARLREIQAANGQIEIAQARFKQGETLAVGSGALSLNADGRLQGTLNLTVAGLEPFLKAIGAEQMVERSSSMDKLASKLNKFAPGLGDAARKQLGANLGAGISMLGEATTLEGRNAVALPLRFDDGAMFLGPIAIGKTPALF